MPKTTTSSTEAPVKVIFRKYPDTKIKGSYGPETLEGDVIALFPESPASCVNWWTVDSVASDGYCSATMEAVYSQTKPATPEQYADLKKYLETDENPIVVKPYQRETQAMRDVRQQKWREMMGYQGR